MFDAHTTSTTYGHYGGCCFDPPHRYFRARCHSLTRHTSSLLAHSILRRAITPSFTEWIYHNGTQKLLTDLLCQVNFCKRDSKGLLVLTERLPRYEEDGQPARLIRRPVPRFRVRFDGGRRSCKACITVGQIRSRSQLTCIMTAPALGCNVTSSPAEGIMAPTRRVPVWTRWWGDTRQPSDEYAWRAVQRYTAPSHT